MNPSELVLRVSDKERLKSEGKVIAPGVLALDKGDPDFPTPEHICDAAREAMRQGYTHYIPGYGDNELIEAVCETMNAEYGCAFKPGGVVITNGAGEAIYITCAAFISPGDEAIMFTPGYSLYAGNTMMVGGVPVWVPLADDFSLDKDALKSAITDKTKVIFLCNPNNPTAKAFTKEELLYIADLAVEHDLLVVSDEVYRKLYYDGKTHFSLGSVPEIRDRTILIDSFSKTYAMTGWRIGYVASTPELAQYMYIVHRTSLSCINWPTQRAVLAALRGPQDCVAEMVAEYDRRRKAILKKLEAVEGLHCVVPDSTFYIMGRFDADMKSAEMVEYLYKKKVAVRSGTEFGPKGEGWIRLAYAVPYDDVIEGIDRLSAAFKDLQTARAKESDINDYEKLG